MGKGRGRRREGVDEEGGGGRGAKEEVKGQEEKGTDRQGGGGLALMLLYLTRLRPVPRRLPALLEAAFSSWDGDAHLGLLGAPPRPLVARFRALLALSAAFSAS